MTGRPYVALLWSISKSATPSRWCKSEVGTVCGLDSFVPTLLTLSDYELSFITTRPLLQPYLRLSMPINLVPPLSQS
jgi:hypothetical protein